ncbi:MAG: inorganic diphosphatase [Parcubacteria group bacterium]|nr:inorganic diphosphatase [Parcubacteria group bacterium]
MDLWHDVELGKDAPNIFNTIVEIPRGSHNKYEIDKETGLIALDRANYGAAPYPFDYGFAPQTLWDDDDALDVILLTTHPLFPGIVVKTRPIAVLEMIDTGESDFKIIGVPADDKRFDNIHDLEDMNEHNLLEYKNFFETYKDLAGKDAKVEIQGFKGKSDAIAAVERSVKLYKDKFKK